MSEDGGHLVLDDISVLLARYVAFPSAECLVAVVLWVGHARPRLLRVDTPARAPLPRERIRQDTDARGARAPRSRTDARRQHERRRALPRRRRRQPTLLLDEADTYLGNTVAKQHEDIRGLINAGHRRGATTYRGEVSGKKVTVVEFPAFAACALAGIGDLPDTILDRSVIVPMKRRAPDEHVEPFRERLVKHEAEKLRDRPAAWAESTPTSSATPGPKCPTASSTGPPTCGKH